MPKILQDIKEQMLTNAENILKNDGYSALSIRRIASECKVASGTVYNYFKSKDDLIANIMMKDWEVVINELNSISKKSHDLTDGFRIMYKALTNFISKYSDIWKQYSDNGGNGSVIFIHHYELRKQISTSISKMIENSKKSDLLPLSDLLAETLLSATLQKDIDEDTFIFMITKLTK